jgi:hypothetical protein
MRNRFNKPIDIENQWTNLGYKPESSSLLFILPLVQVAWAEGFMQRAERRTILRFAADLNITQESEGYEDLLNWLDERPSDEFFASATELLNHWLEIMPQKQRENLRKMLLIGCLEVAQSSVDIGLHPKKSRIRREEREQLSHLGDRLGFSPALAY